MARPKKQRRVCAEPVRCRFSPEHGAIGDPILLTVDEYEALRLIDLEHLTQEQCAAQMQVARTTVTAIYDTARQKLAEMLVHGKALEISGGDVTVCGHLDHCCGKCGAGQCHCGNTNCTRRPED